jgi:hypothetical protein
MRLILEPYSDLPWDVSPGSWTTPTYTHYVMHAFTVLRVSAWSRAVLCTASPRFPQLTGIERKKLVQTYDYCTYPSLQSAIVSARRFIRLLQNFIRECNLCLKTTNPM